MVFLSILFGAVTKLQLAIADTTTAPALFIVGQ